MDFELIDSKLSDANACLHELYKQERRAFDFRNVFARNHDGFLAVCATARGLFHGRGDRKRDAAIRAWKSDWEQHVLTPEERRLYEFMQRERDDTQHAGVSKLAVQVVDVQVGNQYQDDTCTITSAAGPPGMGMGGATITKKRTFITLTVLNAT